VSAALAAVIDRATAKHLARRYSGAHAMVADLETALAIETARAGTASGEAEAVLHTLPEAAARQVPLRVRRRGTVAASGGVVALVAIAGVLLALARTHVESGRAGGGRKATARGVETAVSLANATATAYNPFGTGLEHATTAARVLDGQPTTAWSTNHYADGKLGKPGVGVFVSVADPVLANRLVLTTPTPGFAVQVWGAARFAGYRAGTAQRLARLGWRLLGGAQRVGATQTIALRDSQANFRYYLVWITRLPASDVSATWTSAEVGDIALWRAVPG
jgi:serine/threonine-protein kinase